MNGMFQSATNFNQNIIN
ncbi:hypothetical protein JIY74_25130 [Vibrio harveyi]|nr:hypothetical protein [Vibrio harveyi]